MFRHIVLRDVIQKSFHDVSREINMINEEPNARVNRTNAW